MLGLMMRMVRLPKIAGRYRPELHYMRGPGPATRRKRSAATL